MDIVTTACAVGSVRHANGMNARWATGPRQGTTQYLKAEKNWRTGKVPWTGECPTEEWMQHLRSAASSSLMRRQLANAPGRDRTGSPDTPANQRAVLISDANTPGCLPSNGYMNSTTTSTLGFVFVQLHSEHIIFNTLWNGLD